MSRRLLACVAFHYSEEKFGHMKNVVENFLSNYPESNVIVDTNDLDSERRIRSEIDGFGRLRVFAHENLHHRFHLAWMHRRHIRRELDAHDVFMYVEDDILVPYENFLNYLSAFEILWPRYIPSFIRTEEKDGWLYCPDSFKKTRIKNSEVIRVQGRTFVGMDNPYHGFWIMPRESLKSTMNEKFEEIHESKVWVREIAASYGLAPGCKPHANWASNDPQWRGVVEVDERMRISTLCYAKHTTNKYINDQGFDFGKIRVDKLIKSDAMME